MTRTQVPSAQISDGSIVNVDVAAAAAISGQKISPDFGSQTVQTTGSIKVTSNSGLYLGRFSDAQETTLASGLVSGDGGVTWFNTTDSQFKGWNGTAIIILG